MEHLNIFQSLSGRRVHLVGIKGTGMTAFAEVLAARGAVLSGSDVKEKFYTDKILEALQIPVNEEFSAANVTPDLSLVIFSPAYSLESNPDLIRATKLKIPTLNYPSALGIFSRVPVSCGVSGIHGKSTTTALAGTIVKQLELPATILAGTQVPTFAGRCTLCRGDKYFIAETCEYRAHFLNFHPSHIIITSIELDHPDFFKNIEDVYRVFALYGAKLPPGGSLIYNADDPGVLEVVRRLPQAQLRLIPYGEQARGDFRISGIRSAAGSLSFALEGMGKGFTLRVPGRHNVWNATAALALARVLLEEERGVVTAGDVRRMQEGLLAFSGTRRRSEVLGEAGGVLFIDDYAHHPTAILKTLQGYREFYPGRRLVVDFMPHTYSRTITLLEQYGSCFAPADEVLLHRIYASARESNVSGVTGRDLFKQVKKQHPRVRYMDQFKEAGEWLLANLKPGDVCVTMGAGDNWQVGRKVFEEMG